MNLKNAIAIIGMHGRFPKSSSLDHFWSNLKEGQELITFFTDDELKDIDDPVNKQTNYVKAKGYLEGVEYFDASFFGYTPREAEYMDPQHRVLLECAWHALENAGYDPLQFQKRIGVFVGSSISTYLMFNVLPHALQGDWQNPYNQSVVMTGNDKDFLATKISYKLNLTGPSKTIQTACSTSLVAIHDACQNLLDYSCDMALAGGASITCPLKSGYLFFKEGINSPDGHCRAFDAKSEGTLIGNGVGLVVLKRLEDAIEERDNIHSIILGSAINNDGNRKLGFTAPSIEGQSEAITEALIMSGINPETITYVEAHGTGTKLGDPVELKALTRAFSCQTSKKQFCCLGSVKTNIGHLDAAAGVAGLIKVILSIKHGIIPPTLHYSSPNPELKLETTPFFINNKPLIWKSTEFPLRAGISSFGIGGTNAHLVVEEPPKESRILQPETTQCLLMLSAHTSEALKKIKLNLINFLQKNERNLSDISFTLNTGRKQLPYRAFITCLNRQEAIEKLLKSLEDEINLTPSSNRHSIWVFPSSEEASIDYSYSLLNSYPSLKKNVEICLEKFKNELTKSPYTGPNCLSLQDLVEHRTVVNFAIQYSLAKFMQNIGVEPEQLLGIGTGLYIAMVIANIMKLDDAITCICYKLKGINLNQITYPISFSPPSVSLLSPLDYSLISIKSLEDIDFWDMQRSLQSEELFLDAFRSKFSILCFNRKSKKNNNDLSCLDSEIFDLSLNNVNEDNSLLKVLGKLWKQGYGKQWLFLYEGSNFWRTDLPGYPFEQKKYWIEPPSIVKQETLNLQKFHASPSIISSFDLPMNGIEEKLFQIWKQTLKIPNIGIEDSFFDLGGDSLVALEIKYEILLHFYIDIPIKAFFDKPNIKEMASHIQNLLLENISQLNEEQTDKILMYMEKTK